MAKKILIVDDNQDTLNILGAILKREGYQVLLAKDGLEAIEKVREASPSLILLDIMMPKIDGFGVLQALKQDSRFMKIPVLVVTAKTDPISKNQSLGLGASDFLIKPVNPAEIIRKIKQHLGDEAPPSSPPLKAVFLSFSIFLQWLCSWDVPVVKNKTTC